MDDQWPGLTDQQWDAIKGLLPRRKKPYFRAQRRGSRPRVDDKKVFEAILWTMRGPYHLERLPDRFAKRRTVCRRLHQWVRDDALFRLWEHYLAQLGREELEEWDRLASSRPQKELWRGMMTVSVKILTGSINKRISPGS